MWSITNSCAPLHLLICLILVALLVLFVLLILFILFLSSFIPSWFHVLFVTNSSIHLLFLIPILFFFASFQGFKLPQLWFTAFSHMFHGVLVGGLLWFDLQNLCTTMCLQNVSRCLHKACLCNMLSHSRTFAEQCCQPCWCDKKDISAKRSVCSVEGFDSTLGHSA